MTAGKGWISDLQFTKPEPRIQRWLCGGGTQGLVRSGCTGPGVPRQGEAEDAGMRQQGHKAQGLEDSLHGQGPRETSGLRWVGTDSGRDTKTWMSKCRGEVNAGRALGTLPLSERGIA